MPTPPFKPSPTRLRNALAQLEISGLRYCKSGKTVFVPESTTPPEDRFSNACREAVAELQKMGYVLQSVIE